MVSLKKHFKILCLLGLLYGVSNRASATANDNFVAQMKADYQIISDYINGQFAKSMGFFSTLGRNTPPGVFDLAGSPKVEVGFGAGADFVSLTNINGLPLGALLVGSNVSIPSNVPVPFPIVTARLGLLHGLDFGLRVAYLPQINLTDLGVGAGFNGLGIDLRYRILDGVQLPTVTVGVSWDTMSGSFSLTTKVNQNSTYTDPPGSGISYNANLSGTTSYQQNWNVRSFGAQIMVGKDLGLLFPFGGLGFQRNSGSVFSTIGGPVTETVTGPNPATTVVGSSTVNVSVVSNAIPVVFEPKFVLGIDVGEGFHWAVVGESNGTDIAGNTSFRVQF